MGTRVSSLPKPLCRSFIVETPDRLMAPAAGEAHIPFALWLTDALRPKVFVELGVRTGSSYCAFLHAIKKLQLTTQCYGIDTWRGGDHPGFYDDDGLPELSKYHDRRSSHLPSLIRQAFDKSKLRDGAIVLLHGVNLGRNDSGVWKLRTGPATTHRHFRFDHGSGLGVTGIGQRFAKDAEWLFDLSPAPEEAVVVRSSFTALGDALPARLKLDIAGTDVVKQGSDRATNGRIRA